MKIDESAPGVRFTERAQPRAPRTEVAVARVADAREALGGG